MARDFGNLNFGSIFGVDPMGMSPGLGRVMAQNPDLIAAWFAQAGVPPPPDQPATMTDESAEPTGQLHSAPPIPMMPGAEEPAAPPSAPSLVEPSIPMTGQEYPPAPTFSQPMPPERIPTMGEFFHPAAPLVRPTSVPNPNIPDVPPMAPGG